MALKIRRGNTSQRTAITPASGELVFDTQEVKLYVGNGSTAGGIPVVAGVVGGNLGSNLNLNNFDILGTGNININGTITATGNINLGDTDADNVAFGGEINSNIVPNTSNSFTLGTGSKYWQTVFVNAVSSNGNISITGNISTDGNIVPTGNKVTNLGAAGNRWNDIYAEKLVLDSVTISGNTISTTVSNANLVLDPGGVGVVETAVLQANETVAIGVGTKPLLISDDGSGVAALLWRADTLTSSIDVVQSANSGAYTQLVTNTAETTNIFTFPVSTGAAEFTVFARNANGVQLSKIFFTNIAGVSSVTTVSTHSQGTAPFASFNSNGLTLRAVTNTTTASGVATSLIYYVSIFGS